MLSLWNPLNNWSSDATEPSPSLSLDLYKWHSLLRQCPLLPWACETVRGFLLSTPLPRPSTGLLQHLCDLADDYVKPSPSKSQLHVHWLKNVSLCPKSRMSLEQKSLKSLLKRLQLTFPAATESTARWRQTMNSFEDVDIWHQSCQQYWQHFQNSI